MSRRARRGAVAVAAALFLILGVTLWVGMRVGQAGLTETVLGDVRDWDLAIDEAEEAFEGQDNGLLRDWHRQHKRARKKARAWFETEAGALKQDLEKLLVDPPAKPESQIALGERAADLLRRPLKRLRKAFAQLDRDDDVLEIDALAAEQADLEVLPGVG